MNPTHDALLIFAARHLADLHEEARNERELRSLETPSPFRLTLARSLRSLAWRLEPRLRDEPRHLLR